MSPDKLLNSILALSVEVLKLMHGGELLYIEPVRSDNVCTTGQGKKEEVKNNQLCNAITNVFLASRTNTTSQLSPL